MGAGLLSSLLTETAGAIIGRIAWKAIVERYAIRKVISLLRWVAESDYNVLSHKTVDEIVLSLSNQKLPVADYYAEEIKTKKVNELNN